MYLWKIEYNNCSNCELNSCVVNCFKLCIFERLNTTDKYYNRPYELLWIALNYVSLKDWIQQREAKPSTIASCELL